MCDFAADAAAAEQLLVGRVLTVKRVRELNAKDYFYQMLKDNPEMLKIHPGIENELLKNAIDCHVTRRKPACARSPSRTIGMCLRVRPTWRRSISII